MFQFGQYFIALLLILQRIVEGSEGPNNEVKNLTENALIREVIQEANEKFFLPSFRLVLLKEVPVLIQIIAQWQYDDWHSYDASLTLEKIINDFENQLMESGMPFTIVALKEGVPIGSIALKKEGEPEFSDLACKTLWVDSFHVIPSERHQGIGQGLGNVVLSIATRLGYSEVFFFTSNYANVAKYAKRGAQIVETRPFRGHTITLMKLNLKI